MEMRSGALQQGVTSFLGTSLHITTNILVGENYADTALGFIQSNNYDLVAIPRKTKESSWIKFNPKFNPLQFIEHLEVPVVLY
jgi:hypothetical protein